MAWIAGNVSLGIDFGRCCIMARLKIVWPVFAIAIYLIPSLARFAAFQIVFAHKRKLYDAKERYVTKRRHAATTSIYYH